MSLDQLLAHAAAASGLSMEDLSAAGKKRHRSRWRQVVIAIARRRLRIPTVELARRFGRSESCVSMVLARIGETWETCPETQRLLERLASNKCEM